MGWENAFAVLFEAGETVVINENGQFVYNGAPALGNLVVSITPTGGTDPYGNVYAQGIVDYSGTHYTQLTQGFLQFNTTNPPVGGDGGFVSWTPYPHSSLNINSGVNSSTDTPSITVMQSANTSATSVQRNISDPIFAWDATGNHGVNIEVWHTLTNPTGVTGTIRVKMSPLGDFAILDINASITSDLTTPTSYVTGNLPTGTPSYYPATSHMYDVSVNQQWSTTANASPRILIPTSGGVSLQMPGFNAAGNTCLVAGTILYPLD